MTLTHYMKNRHGALELEHVTLPAEHDVGKKKKMNT